MCLAHDHYHYLPNFVDVLVFDDDDRLLSERLTLTITVTEPVRKPGGCGAWSGLALAFTTWIPAPALYLKNVFNSIILITCSANKGFPGTPGGTGG